MVIYACYYKIIVQDLAHAFLLESNKLVVFTCIAVDFFVTKAYPMFPCSDSTCVAGRGLPKQADGKGLKKNPRNFL